MTDSSNDVNTIRVLLVDDHEVVRVGLRTLFAREEDIDVVGEAGTAAEAVKEAANLHPDVIVMDMRLPDGSGVDACRQIRADDPHARVLFITSYDDQEAMLSAALAGADGYLLKEIGREPLLAAVRSVAAGEPILDPGATRALLDHLQSGETGSGTANREELSAREQRVLGLVAEGKTNKEIAAELGLSPKTVKNHLSNIFQKLQVKRRAEAAAMYARNSST